MNRYIYPSIILGLLLGAISGLLMLLPFISTFVFFLLFWVISPIIIFYLKKNAFFSIFTLPEGTLLGAASGFISMISGCFVYFLTVALIEKLLFQGKIIFTGIASVLNLAGYDIFVIAMLVFFTALLSALFNAFTGMITTYIIEKIEGKPMNFQDHIDIEHSE